MSDAVKWALLGVLLAAVVIALVAFVMAGGLGEKLPAALSYVVGGLDYVTPYLQAGREMLNMFFFPPILSAALYIVLLRPVWVLTSFLMTAIIRAIYK